MKSGFALQQNPFLSCVSCSFCSPPCLKGPPTFGGGIVQYQSFHHPQSPFPWGQIHTGGCGCLAPEHHRIIQALQPTLFPATCQGWGETPCCRENQLLPGPVRVLVVHNLFSHGLLPPPPASDSVDLKSASTLLLPGFWLGQQPRHQHRRALPWGGAWDAQPVSVNPAQSHCPA